LRSSLVPPLAQRGEREAIEHIRRRFQQQMADEFTSVVEQATGRKVRVFLSETNTEQDVSSRGTARSGRAQPRTAPLSLRANPCTREGPR
jgi:Na+-translocating membrane potential-generating system (MpsC)